ncbi:geranylgeranyl transferase type-2 subunit alpha-like, partial [Oppia nitens]|uniref:geranylgeranyl transferase type-2 subunit alpha-like n=1 Tax=Oppia nitens TaxID=1686743 RepID=UPI0023DAEFB6
MHNRLKVKSDSQKELEKRREKEDKCRQLIALQNLVFDRRTHKDYGTESLSLSAQLVAANPDLSTAWNYRREILLQLKSESLENSESFDTICRNELQLTENCLRVNPKSYCVWHQRKWIIELMANPDLKNEILLCNQCLSLDERNFLAWDYRRFVSKIAKIDVSEEQKFTLRKIEENFSNFSSWYYRSCLFRTAVTQNNYDFSQDWHQEYDLVQNAIFTDPTDQSAWFYHKWLVATNYGHNIVCTANELQTKNIQINRVVYNQTTAQLSVHFSRPLKFKPLISLKINNNWLTKTEWQSTFVGNSSVWFIDFNQLDEFKELTIMSIPTFDVNREAIEEITIKVDNLNDITDKQVLVWERSSNLLDNNLTLEESYLKSLRELHKLEPNNKWVNLTLAWTDPNSQVNDILDKLIKLDPLRVNYYNDLKSKTILREKINSFQLASNVTLINLNLTTLYDCNRLSHIRTLDFSQNNLLKLSQSFNQLVSLEVLMLDSNKIYTIDENMRLVNLKILSLNNNKIYDKKCLTHLKECLKLEKLVINENPISCHLKNITNSELLLSSKLK